MTGTPPALDESLFDQAVPRYTSYPTLARFGAGIGPTEFDLWLRDLRTDAKIGLYLHIPFCRSICWFCVCRTQRTSDAAAIARYVAALQAEIARAAALLPEGVRVTRIHWGGGSPTILSPDLMMRLVGHLRATLPVVPGATLSVEIDPRACDHPLLDALAASGVAEAILAVPDFDPMVQRAIGRWQTAEDTIACMTGLRARGVASVAIDMMYGLPHQTAASLTATLQTVLSMRPDRISMIGYAHAPWIAKRQRMIAEAVLPNTAERLRQVKTTGRTLRAAGYVACGIDHFARAGDPLACAVAERRLRRGFQGYAADYTDALIGFGASAISRFPQGFVQNAVETGAYLARVERGLGAAQRGVALSLEDRIRGRAIEMIMCDFRLDLGRLRSEFGDFVAILQPGVKAGLERFARHLRYDGDTLEIVCDGPLLARLVARLFDPLCSDADRHSQAI